MDRRLVVALLLCSVFSFGVTLAADERVEKIKDQRLSRAIYLSNQASTPLRANHRMAERQRLPGISQAPLDPIIIADRFLEQQGDSFGPTAAVKQLMPRSAEQDNLGITHVRYQQWYKGIPVFGTDVAVRIDRNHQVASVNGKMVPEINLNTRARVTRARAVVLARNQFRKGYPKVIPGLNGTRLLVFNKGVIENSPDTTTNLVWEVRLSSDSPMVDQYYYINAHNGRLVYQLSGTRGADYTIDRSICDCFRPEWFSSGCACGRTTSRHPGYRFGRREYHTDICGPHPYKTDYPNDTDNLFDLVGELHEYFWTKFGRDGGNDRGGLGDGSGAGISISRGLVYLEGTGWDCEARPAGFASYQIQFCQGTVVPDTVGHEYGHAITHFRWDINGNLNSMIYQGESGALEENYSDIVAESFEYHLTGSTDWLFGTNDLYGPYRNMADPPNVEGGTYDGKPRPDRYYHDEFYCGEEDDGGVHYNANVVNKAAYLISEGGQFNGCTVQGIGIEKMEQIFYRAASLYYLATESFNQAYYSIINSCNDLYSEEDCAQVTAALQSVELDQPGLCADPNQEQRTPPACALNSDPATVVGRHVFYNNSAYDKNNPAANADDDAAIAIDKAPLFPGEKAQFVNYTNYRRGINGIMVDIEGLPEGAELTVADFEFKVGNSSTSDDFAIAPSPTSITIRPGAGVNESDRVTIIWADNTIKSKWLQITTLATISTGLEAPDTFYFGSAVGEVGNSASNAIVNAVDQLLIRQHASGLSPVPVTNRYDIDKNRLVNATDVLLARQHTSGTNPLLLITAP